MHDFTLFTAVPVLFNMYTDKDSNLISNRWPLLSLKACPSLCEVFTVRLLNVLNRPSKCSTNWVVSLALSGRCFRVTKADIPAATEGLYTCTAKFTHIAEKGSNYICLSFNFGAIWIGWHFSKL